MNASPIHGIVQIGLVVEDAEATARSYQELLGVGDWNVNEVDTAGGVGSDFRLRGKLIEAKAKVVWSTFLGVELELIEPQDETSVYAEFLRERGPGIHHVMLGTADHEAARRTLTSRGLSVLAEGELGGGSFELFDTAESLGMIVEIAAGESLAPDRSL